MKLIIDGDWWHPTDEWVQTEIEIEIIDEERVSICLLREENDPAILLPIKTLEWAIETLISGKD